VNVARANAGLTDLKGKSGFAGSLPVFGFLMPVCILERNPASQEQRVQVPFFSPDAIFTVCFARII
jgi:hypothetical protein